MIKPILCLIAGAIAFDAMMAAAEPPDAKPRPLGGLLCNLDCTEFFLNPPIAGGKAGESIDKYVDDVAGAGVTVLLCNTNARRTNYRSRVWDSFWDGYDPAGPDDQPFLAPSRGARCGPIGSSLATCWPSIGRASTIQPA